MIVTNDSNLAQNICSLVLHIILLLQLSVNARFVRARIGITEAVTRIQGYRKKWNNDKTDSRRTTIYPVFAEESKNSAEWLCDEIDQRTENENTRNFFF